MTDLSHVAFGREARRLKLDTVVRLRWLAVTGQCLAVSLVYLHLGYRLPFLPCLGVIAASAAVNLWLTVREPASHRLAERPAVVLFAFDILQLAALLYLTGGLENPFAMLLLAPVLISAASLSPTRTTALALLAGICATLLTRFHLPLPWSTPGGFVLPDFYLVGIWSALLLAIVFTAVFSYRVAEEARQLGEALAATEFVLAREQHLSQLDGLAAAAAHELGTPLATIRLVAKELALQAAPDSAMAEDTKLLREEVERCRLILSKLTSLGQDEGGGFFGTMSLGHVIEEVVEPRRSFDIELLVDRSGEGNEPVCRRSPGLMFSLGNLIDNAADFARERVVVRARWTPETVSLEIRDDGAGFAPEILLRVGEPYVTTRGGGREHDGGGGLGLGLFISKTLIERSGAQLTLWNAGPPNGGAVASIVWPRPVFERDAGEAPTPSMSQALSQAEPFPI